MNNYGCVVREMGFGKWLDSFMSSVVQPLGSMLFPHWGGATLDHEHSFAIAYRYDTHLRDMTNMYIHKCNH